MNKLTILFTLSALLSCSYLLSQINPERLLFENGIANNPVTHPTKEIVVDSLVSPNSLSHSNRVISNISIPTFVLYPASASNNKHIGVVIYPGGGLVTNWVDKEGTDLAIWLSANGINCMVVKYRTNRKDEKGNLILDFNDYKGAIYLDARASILKMKELSDSLKIDKDKIGILGFSAGGWLSERTIFRALEAGSPVDWKPAFVGLVYHGDKIQALKAVKNKSELPPFFMAMARDDNKIPIKEVLPFLSTIVEEVDKSELHIYSKGSHGFGLAYDNGHSVELWKNSFYSWLLDIFDK